MVISWQNIGEGLSSQVSAKNESAGSNSIACLRRPQLLVVGSFISSAPLERYVSGDLAERLRACGWTVAVTSRKINRVGRLADMLWTVIRRRSSYALALVDVFSGPAFFWAECVCWLLQRNGKPFVLTLHGGNLPKFAERWPLRVRRLLNQAAAVTTPSQYLLTGMRPYRADLRVIPNPIQLARYLFRLRDRPKPRLIWLRDFHEIYNPSMAPRVVAHLLDHESRSRLTGSMLTPSSLPEHSAVKVCLTMFGADKGDGSLDLVREEVCRLKLRDRVRLMGPVVKAQVPSALSAGDIFLNTTNFDNTPVSVIEAMASGLCLVSTNVGGIPYLVENGINGLLVPPNNAPAMASAVQRILAEPDLAERLSRSARAKAEQFDWAIILPQWEKLLTNIANT